MKKLFLVFALAFSASAMFAQKDVAQRNYDVQMAGLTDLLKTGQITQEQFDIKATSYRARLDAQLAAAGTTTTTETAAPAKPVLTDEQKAARKRELVKEFEAGKITKEELVKLTGEL